MSDSGVRRAIVTIIHPEPSHRSSNADADIKSLVRRLVAIEDRIDAENKLKALVYAEAKVSGVDIGALKAVVRAHQYLPESRASGLSALSETVKRYLDMVTEAHVSSVRKNSGDE